MRLSCDHFNTRLLTRFVLAFVILTCAKLSYGLDPSKQISQYAHTAWRTKDGTFSGAPYSIAQTTDGYIWVGTQSGILRFDGVRFVSWAPPGGESLRSVEVDALLGTADGALWIGTRQDGLWRWANGKLTGYLLSNRSAVTAILEGTGESVWIARVGVADDVGGICEGGGGTIRCYGESNGIPHGCCEDLAKDGAGNLWIGSTAALIKWKPRSSETYISKIPSMLEDQSHTSLAPQQDGSIWVGVNNGPRLSRGLQLFRNGSWSHLVTSNWNSRNDGADALLLDSQHSLWLGTGRQGVYRIRDGKVDHFDSAEGLSGDSINRIFEDHEGNLWVLTTNGLDCFRDLTVTTFTTREGLGAAEVDTVLAARDGTVWAGGDRSLDWIHDGRITSLKTEKGLPGVQVTSMLEDHAGRLWVGIDHTMFLLKNGRFSEVKKPDGQTLGLVVGITEDTDDNVWVEVSANPRELIRIRDQKVMEEFRAPEMPAARKVAADPKGGIWLGLMSGDMARYRSGKLETFRFEHEAQSFVNQISVSPDGSVLGATKFGLIGWREGKQQILTVRNGLPCNGVNAHIWDDRGSLWLYTQCGLIQITGSEFQRWWGDAAAVLKMRVLDADDGFQAGLAPFQEAARSSDGKLWFVNQSNLQMIDPVHLPVNAIPPPVHVEEVTANGHTFSPAEGLRLAPLTRDIAIRYTALSFVAPQKVRFRYMLEGQDKTWQQAGTRREAFYTNLAPGSYRFRVMACNNSGLWNEVGATWRFQIAPAFYQTGWFRFVCILAGITLCISLYLFRLKQATAEIQARLSERLVERERIARELHDTLLQGFQGLILRFQGAINTMPVGPGRESLDLALQRADDVMSEARQSVKKLRTQHARDDFEIGISTCCEDLAEVYGTPFQLSVIGSSIALNPVAAQEAYKIIREALMNAFQHANASMIQVEIMYERDALVLGVRDNGIGIDESILKRGRTGHWGITGMRERAEKIGAEFRILSRPGSGTEVKMKLAATIAYVKSGHRTRLGRLRMLLWRLGNSQKVFRGSPDPDD